MAADVKRQFRLKFVFNGILIYFLIDLGTAQQFRGRSMFPTRWNPRTVLSQTSMSQYNPRTIRNQDPLIERIKTSRFRPIRIPGRFASRNRFNSQPIRGLDRFTDLHRALRQPIDFQLPRLSEVNVPSVQRSMIHERGNNDSPIRLTSRSHIPRQIQRRQMTSSQIIGPRDQFTQQITDNREQQIQMRFATAGNIHQRDISQRSLSSIDQNDNRRILPRRISGLPRLSVSKIPRQPIISMRQISERRSRSRSTSPSLRTRITSTNAKANDISKQFQPLLLQKSATPNIMQQPLAVRNRKLPQVVSRVKPKQSIPMVLSTKHKPQDKTLHTKGGQQSRTLVSQVQQQTSMSQQQPQVFITQNPPIQTGITHVQQQVPVIVTNKRPIHIAQPEIQKTTIPVSQTTGNAVVQQTNIGQGQTVITETVQNVVPAGGSTAQQGTVQYLPVAGNSGIQTSSVAVPSHPGTTDLVFEELVNAFTVALENPTGQQTTAVQTNPIIHNMHPQTALQNGIHPHSHTGVMHHGVMQHGGLVHPMGPSGMFAGHGHGNRFGFMNPWMMGGMNSAMMQEMMFGDTTDPPDPIATTTTTAAPAVTAPPAASVNKTSPNLTIVNSTTLLDLPASDITVRTAADPATKLSAANKSIYISKPEVSVGELPVAVQQASVVADVSQAVVTLAAKNKPNIVDVITVPDVIQNPVQTKEPQKESAPVVEITQTGHVVKPTLAPAITKASMTLEQKLMAEVKAMLANTQVDMSMISQVVGQVANELNGAAVEHLPSATQLGLKTLGSDPSAKKLSKKERVSELIGSTRGVVVYPPTPPSVKIVTKTNEVKADVINKTKQPTNVVTKKILQDTISATHILKEKKKPLGTSTIVVTTKIPPHVDIPTLPPKSANMAESPEVYRTLQTILDHNPSALVQVLENPSVPTTQSPPGPKISIKSLVDIGLKTNLANLQSILTDISTGVNTNSRNKSTNTQQTETKFEPLVTKLNVANTVNMTASVATVPKMNDIKIEPLSTLIKSAHDVTYEAFSSNLPAVPTTPGTESMVSTVINLPSEIIPTTANPIFTDAGNTQETTNQVWTTDTVTPFVFTDTTTVASNSTLSANFEGVAVNISELNSSMPTLANMEGVPVHVERLSPIEHSSSSENLDATGALSILHEIKSFGPNSSSSKHDAIANKLSDPNYVNILRNLLQTMMKKASVSTTAAPLWSNIPEFSTTSFPVSTTSLPISSTEEYEAEDFITTTPAE